LESKWNVGYARTATFMIDATIYVWMSSLFATARVGDMRHRRCLPACRAVGTRRAHLELVAKGNVVGGGRGELRVGWRQDVGAARGDRGSGVSFVSAQDLADVKVGAVFVDLGVVEGQHGNVCSGFARYAIAGIVSPDDIVDGAVMASDAETEVIAGGKVGARGVNLLVEDGELVRGYIFVGGNAVADVTRLDDVGTDTGLSQSRLSEGEDGENCYYYLREHIVCTCRPNECGFVKRAGLRERGTRLVEVQK